MHPNTGINGWYRSWLLGLILTIVLGFFILFSESAQAQSKYNFTVYISYENEDAIKRSALINAIQEKIATNRYFPSSIQELKKDSVVISIGYDNLVKLVDSKIPTQILAVGISSASFKEISRQRPNLSAIFIEPSPESQFRLISSLTGNRPNRVTFIYSTKTDFLKPLVQAAANAAGNIDLKSQLVTNDDELYKAINHNTSKWLLAYPDKNIYNQSSIKNVILTLYRNDQAIIGFSKSLVSAGALGTAAPTDDGYARQINEFVQVFSSTGKLPSPTFSKYTKYIINASVARSLNFVINDDLEKESDVIR